jgi:hypothetical protein
MGTPPSPDNFLRFSAARFGLIDEDRQSQSARLQGRPQLLRRAGEHLTQAGVGRIVLFKRFPGQAR